MVETQTSRIEYRPQTINSWRDEAHFIIPEVSYRGENADYRIFEKMTSAMKQDSLAELHEQEKPKGNPHPTDAPLIWAIASQGYNLKDENPEEAEKLRVFLKKGFRQYPNTLTRVIYNPNEEDEVVHNYGTSDRYSLNANIVGQDGWVGDIDNRRVLESLLGTEDIEEINKVSQWINGTDSYFWRINLKPEGKTERVAGFFADSDRLDLFALRLPLVECPAFRVLKVE